MTIKRAALTCAASAIALGATACATAMDDGDSMGAAELSPLLQENFAVFEESICPAADGETPFPPLASVADDPTIPPAQVFDNLYFVGNLVDSAWALETSDGLIIFDAMFPFEVEPHLIAGLEALGLDPADIEYVVVAHGHADHFGGAALLQERYGAQVAMSNTEWHYLYDTQADGDAPLPERDVTVLDGDTLTLGDATVRFMVTPGHTPGVLSSFFTVYDDGEPHHAALWGGTAMNFLSVDDIEVHKRSAARFSAFDPDVDVALSNHQYADGTILKNDALAERAPGDPNPWVIGQAAFQNWMAITETCADAWIAQKSAE
jgi:metallo-beta-lactamase class B